MRDKLSVEAVDETIEGGGEKKAIDEKKLF